MTYSMPEDRARQNCWWQYSMCVCRKENENKYYKRICSIIVFVFICNVIQCENSCEEFIFEIKMSLIIVIFMTLTTETHLKIIYN